MERKEKKKWLKPKIKEVKIKKQEGIMACDKVDYADGIECVVGLAYT